MTAQASAPDTEPDAEPDAEPDTEPDTEPDARRLSRVEFVAVIAMLFATIAFSIDAMLPALPEIAGALTPDAPNRAQLIVTSFVLGMGVGTLVTGPVSDAVGRKPVILGGAVLYVAGAALAWHARSLEALLVGRVIQGLGAAGPRVVAIAIVRDLYAGRAMATIMSFVMTVFTLAPAAAPLLGAAVIAAAGWRAIFAMFLVFSVVSVSWLTIRQPETLPPGPRRRPLRAGRLLAAAAEVLTNRTVLVSTAAQTLALAMLFSMISTVQPVFDQTFGRAASFPLWFAGIALFSASGSLLNAALVGRLGMRPIATAMLGAQAGISWGMVVLFAVGVLGTPAGFAAYLAWTASLFFSIGLTMGNLNALAMEPMGHVAGLAASVIGAVSTVGAVAIAAPVGLAFDGTPLPVAIGVGTAAALAWALMLLLREPRSAPA